MGEPAELNSKEREEALDLARRIVDGVRDDYSDGWPLMCLMNPSADTDVERWREELMQVLQLAQEVVRLNERACSAPGAQPCQCCER